ncbi:hypothetical protein ACJRO7_019094 [Eucalyptus globulus]|uniref:non-specific serine/threonine protein kinase n=1 Tax=Eucalyptus globulus TaxID=34317 RepID=A0ABD3KBU0_EUCGL
MHEIVPSELMDRIASLKHGGTYKVLKNLLKHKLNSRDSVPWIPIVSNFSSLLDIDDGFRLTYLGYNFLAIKTMVNREVFTAVVVKLGSGRSLISAVAKEDGSILAVKLHRLGRTFRAVKSKRDYLRHRRSYNWLYLSSALKRIFFYEEHGFPIPNAVECNRHCVVMSLIHGYPLVQARELQSPEVVFERILGLIVRLAEHGLIHCDFNEFNIMIDDEEKVTMIDFPQMVSVSHHNAQMYFDRDVDCIFKFFSKRFNLSLEEQIDNPDNSEEDSEGSYRPCFYSISKSVGFLDKELAASGFTGKEQDDMDKFVEEEKDQDICSDDEEDGAGMDETIMRDVDIFASPGHIVEGNEEEIKENRQSCEGQFSEPCCEAHFNEDESEENANDAELVKRLNKQRWRTIAAVHRGGKTIASRNSYKDKGGRSSHNSKIQKQLSSW